MSHLERDLEQLRSRLGALKPERPPEAHADAIDRSLFELRAHLRGLREEARASRIAVAYHSKTSDDED